jgi:hypothetical protein
VRWIYLVLVERTFGCDVGEAHGGMCMCMCVF